MQILVIFHPILMTVVKTFRFYLLLSLGTQSSIEKTENAIVTSVFASRNISSRGIQTNVLQYDHRKKS